VKGAYDAMRVPGKTTGQVFQTLRDILDISMKNFSTPMMIMRDKMWDKLTTNFNKRGWDKMTKEQIMKRIKEELDELDKAKDPEDIIKECADIANFCMFLVWNTHVKMNTPRELWTCPECYQDCTGDNHGHIDSRARYYCTRHGEDQDVHWKEGE